MPTLADREKQDTRQRAKTRSAQRKHTAVTIARQMLDMINKVRGISEAEWERAVREDQANAA